MATMLYHDARPAREVAPQNGETYTLRELHALLECERIDVVTLRRGRILVIDDRGKLRPRNDAATFEGHAARVLREDDWIAGHALLCLSQEVP